MVFHVLTLFPEMIEAVAKESILGRARKSGLIDIIPVNIRDFTLEKHGKVDDYPYGGGPGMVMQAEPVYSAAMHVLKETGNAPIVYMTAQGRPFNQTVAAEYAAKDLDHIIILCGHYEGIDERVISELSPDEISMGDFVLTGGELPALTFIDCVSRLLPGVLHNEGSAQDESFSNGLLEYPQYTRPENWRGREVPKIILSGDHAAVDRYRHEEAVKRTMERRPDMYRAYSDTPKTT
ncbi:MAG: tRNA (guanosine(37)-N1)-methyltransferase TrmD [Lachnospiraceae bacterium]|nr:tRNA (guanosine(37)-N1)-methyltransferase TrmD [Lachnospiraceae bacterium]